MSERRFRAELLEKVEQLTNTATNLLDGLDDLKSLIGEIPVIPNPGGLPEHKIVGLYYESIYHNPVPLDKMRRLADLGLTHAIYRFPWPRFERKKGELELERLTKDLAALRNAGLKVILARHGVPAWATVDGKPTHEIYEDGCLRLSDWQYNTDKEYCQVPSHVIPEECYRIGYILGEEFGEEIVEHWIAGPNEPGIDVYNPWWWYAHQGKITFQEAVKFTIDEQTLPFTKGVLDATHQWATFIGPEGAGWEDFKWFLEYERDNGLDLYDIVSAHPYSWAEDHSLEGAYERINQFRTANAEVALQNNNVRDMWWTEWGDKLEENRHAEFAKEALKHEDTNALFIHDWEDLLEGDGFSAAGLRLKEILL